MRKSGRMVNVGVLIPWILTLVPFFFAAFFNVPNAEDIELSAIPKRVGFFEHWWWFYELVQGRYFTGALHYLHPLSWGNTHLMWLWPICWILLFLLLHAKLIESVCSIGTKASWLLSLALLSSAICLSNDIPDMVYLTNSLAVYGFPYLLFIQIIIVFLDSLRMPRGGGRFFISVLAVSFGTWMLMGGGEVFFPITGVLVLLMSFSYRDAVIGFTLISAYLSGAVAAFCSPGNLRDLQIEHLVEIGLLADHMGSIYINIYQGGVLLASLILISLVTGKASEQKIKGFEPERITLLGVFAVVVAPVLIYLPFFISVSPEYVGYRVANFSQIPVLLGSIFISVAVGQTLHRWSPKLSALLQRVEVIFIISIITSLSAFGSGNFRQMTQDLYSGKMNRHNDAFHQRVSLLEKAAMFNGDTVIAISPYSDWPELLHRPMEPLPNREQPSWNQAYEYYFGLKEVRLTDDSVSVGDYSTHRFDR